MAKIAWIDKTISELETKTGKDEKVRRKIVEMLQEDYLKILDVARKLEVEGEHVAYPHVRDEIKTLVAKKRQFANKIKELAAELGSELRELPEDGDYFAKGSFRDIFDSEKILFDLLTDHANLAEDYHFKHVAKQLRDIKYENEDMVENLERIIMRINAEI